MADRPELPDKDQLENSSGRCSTWKRRWMNLADLMLELYGIDPGSLNEDLKVKLEREVEGLRARWEQVPPVMLEVLFRLKSMTLPNDEVG